LVQPLISDINFAHATSSSSLSGCENPDNCDDSFCINEDTRIQDESNNESLSDNSIEGEFDDGAEVTSPTDIPDTDSENMSFTPTTQEALIVPVSLDVYEVYVTRLYLEFLGRTPTPTEVSNWSNRLRNGSHTAADVAFGFYSSSEFQRRPGITNTVYVDILYKALLGRDRSSGEGLRWIGLLDSGLPREDVLSGFTGSSEFGTICRHAGLVQGTYTPPPGGMARVFIRRFYVEVLGRVPLANEDNNWHSGLVAGRHTGASVAHGFITSSEFQRRPGITNTVYVDILYRALLGRDRNPGEGLRWIGLLDAGLPRVDVLAGFIGSAEFGSICQQSNIQRGTYTPPPGGMARVFIRRFYVEVLGRVPLANEDNNWHSGLVAGRHTGASVAHGFFSSSEFQRRPGITNTVYVDILYRALLGRDRNSGEGLRWIGLLDTGLPREDVLAGFISSAEFVSICHQSNIQRGSYTPPPGGMARVFVRRLYVDGLGRQPTATEVTNWTNRLLSGSHTGASVAYGFFFSDEMRRQNLSNEQFVNRLYKALFGRDRNPSEGMSWVNQLQNGASRYSVYVAFVNSDEFNRICREHGITRGNPSLP